MTIAPTNEALFTAYLCGDGNALRILMERHGDALTYISTATFTIYMRQKT